MAKSVGKKSPRRSKPTYTTAVLMITLLLFVLGMMGMIFIHFNELSRTAKEQVEMRIVLREGGSEVDHIQMQKQLEAEPYVRSAEYISKEEALVDWQEQGNEDFSDMIEDNPLPAMIVVHCRAEYVETDSMRVIKDKVNSAFSSMIRDVVVNDDQVAGLSSMVRNVLIVLGVVGLLVFGIVLVLIDSTIRLSMYSNRFLVKSMQLVGAQRSFITQPYVKKSVVYGFVSALLAIGLVLAAVLVVQTWFEDLRAVENFTLWGALFAVMIGLGVLISWWSTRRAVTKYLRLKLDELY